MSKGKIILHIDMNSFYASVEAAHQPELKGKPIAIAGNPEERRGIVVTCSYEARSKGVKTTMQVHEALKLCPELIILRPDFTRYRQASKAMFDILRSYTELVEPVSIDEGYMDITELEGNPIDLIKEIQDRILRELDLPCSIGVSPNKFLSKMASDMKKPMGITVIRKREIQEKLWPLPIREMHGVGEKTAEKLSSLSITTISDLAKADDIQLKSLLGINGLKLKSRANGIDPRKVDPESVYDFKSVGNSTTLPKDLTNQTELLKIIDQLSVKVSERLRSKQMLGYGLQVMIRFKNRNTITRSLTLSHPLYDQSHISEHARALFLKHWNGTPVRLLGVTVQDLADKSHAYKQIDLFTYEDDVKYEPVEKVMRELEEKHGKGILTRGLKSSKNHQNAETSFSKDFLDDHN
ncbi:DNA polymerase IV [Jeotgalibacillus haloalkalitolerans]|uniref:DNA polymerase IV n=1 Tax=Jeotgalibacillus haloalkalitolerans TaxID=3104292 RepID=A0ABU5KLE6_9BACL|nr:DNA polymerase IV [Jeotgalibacillus sp. HH7-29]MDZ5712089.1 DNA polymerase IV [Jeotgalibacillus sp. HH7-29]